MAPPPDVRLSAAYLARYNRIRARTAAMVGVLWDLHAGLDDQAAERFSTDSASTVRAAQGATTALVNGYIATAVALVGGSAPDLDDTAPNPRGVEAEEVYQRGIVTARTAVSEGRPYLDALAAGRARSVTAASTDIALVQRDVMTRAVGKAGIVGYRRVLTGKSCALCATASTQRYRTGSLMPIHANCVPAGSTVAVPAGSGPQSPDLTSIQAMTRRRYVGDLAVLDLASGDQVSVTPNHPVLTQRGWVPAGLVCQGDQMISHTAVKRRQRRSPHEGHRPPLVEDVWRALSVMGRLVRMPLAPEDLHGEGADGEVDVVWADSHLPSTLHAELDEPFGDQGLVSGHGRRVGFAGESASVALLDRRLSTAGGCVGCGSLSLPLRPRHLRGAELAGHAAPPRFDAPAEKFSPESAAVYAQRGRDLIGRLAGQVQGDRVVKTSRVGFRGHVYNLHTPEGWYASGCHIVSNCDCGVAPIIGTRDPGHVINRPLLDELKGAGKATGDPDYWRSRKLVVGEDGSVRLPDVQIHEHGELGPVLTDARHGFTSETDIAE